MRDFDGGEPPPDFVHPVCGVVELLLLLGGRDGVEHFEFLFLVECAADVDIDVELVAVVGAQVEGVPGPVLEVVGLVAVPVLLHGLPDALRELVDLVLDYGELIGLADDFPPLPSDACLRSIHNKIISSRNQRNLDIISGLKGQFLLNYYYAYSLSRTIFVYRLLKLNGYGLVCSRC